MGESATGDKVSTESLDKKCWEPGPGLVVDEAKVTW